MINDNVPTTKTIFSKLKKSNLSDSINKIGYIQTIIIYIELVTTFTMIVMTLCEIYYGYIMYSNLNLITSKYYYAHMKSIISTVNILLDFEIKTPNNKCRVETPKEYVFSQIESLNSLCIKTNTNQTNFTLDFSYSNSTICNSTKITLNNPLLIKNWWFNKSLCFNDESSLNFQFIFRKNCAQNERICGGYGGYNYCFSSINGTVLAKCPIFSILNSTRNNNSKNVSNLGEGINFYMVRTVNKDYQFANSLIQFYYGDTKYSFENTDLNDIYNDTSTLKYYDFSNKTFLIVFNNLGNYNLSSKVFIDNINLSISNSIEINNKSYKILNYPRLDFSFNIKDIRLPEENCLSYFEDKDYMQTIQILFIEFISSSIAKYWIWTFVQLIFLINFRVYIQVYLSIKILLKENIFYHDKISNSVTNNVITFFHAFIIFIKGFILLFSKSRMNLRSNFAKFIIDNNCYEDRAFMFSIAIYLNDIGDVLTKFNLCLIMNYIAISFISINFLLFILNRYLYNSKDLHLIKQM